MKSYNFHIRKLEPLNRIDSQNLTNISFHKYGTHYLFPYFVRIFLFYTLNSNYRDTKVCVDKQPKLMTSKNTMTALLFFSPLNAWNVRFPCVSCNKSCVVTMQRGIGAMRHFETFDCRQTAIVATTTVSSLRLLALQRWGKRKSESTTHNLNKSKWK